MHASSLQSAVTRPAKRRGRYRWGDGVRIWHHGEAVLVSIEGMTDLAPQDPQPTAAVGGQRAPGAVVAAALITGGLLVAGGLIAAYTALIAEVAAASMVGALIAAVGVLVAYGLWRGYRGAFVVALVVVGIMTVAGFTQTYPATGMCALVVAVLVGGLLVVPMSSRKWFWG